MSQDPPNDAADESRDVPTRHGHAEADRKATEGAQRGRHELPPDRPRPEIGSVQRPECPDCCGAAAPVWCSEHWPSCCAWCLGLAIVTQVRQTKSGDSLDTARPADLLVLLDSLRQREATLNTEVSRTAAHTESTAGVGQHRPGRHRKRPGPAGCAVHPGRRRRGHRARRHRHNRGPGPGVSPETMLDVINELRAAGAEAIETNDAHQSVRVGVDTWVVGTAGSLTIDSKTLSPPYSILAIGDPPTLAAAMNIPGGAEDSIKRVGARMSVQQANRVDVTTLRQPKPHQYAQPVK